MQAIKIASGVKCDIGSLGGADAKKEEGSQAVASLPNILKELVEPTSVANVDLPPSSISIPKCCVNTFHTWLSRRPDLVGILYGLPMAKSRFRVVRILVATSFCEILEDANQEWMCKTDGVEALGVVLGGHSTLHGETADEWCKKMWAPNKPALLCVFVPCHTSRFF